MLTAVVIGCAGQPAMISPISAVHCPGGFDELGGYLSLLSGDGTTILTVNIFSTEANGTDVHRLTPDALTGFAVSTMRGAHRHCAEHSGDLRGGHPNWKSYEELDGVVTIDGTDAEWAWLDDSPHVVGNGSCTVSWDGLVVGEWEADRRGDVAIDDGASTFDIENFRVDPNPDGT